MNRSELVIKIAEKAQLTRKQADEALSAFVSTVVETLAAGDKVQLVGFGTFDVRARGEHTGINPITKENITIPASKYPYFKPGKTFKDKV